MSTNVNNPNPTGDVQELYAVSEGKKHGATREVRPEAAWDKYCTVVRVHGGDVVLNYTVFNNFATPTRRLSKPRFGANVRTHPRECPPSFASACNARWCGCE